MIKILFSESAFSMARGPLRPWTIDKEKYHSESDIIIRVLRIFGLSWDFWMCAEKLKTALQNEDKS